MSCTFIYSHFTLSFSYNKLFRYERLASDLKRLWNHFCLLAFHVLICLLIFSPVNVNVSLMISHYLKILSTNLKLLMVRERINIYFGNKMIPRMIIIILSNCLEIFITNQRWKTNLINNAINESEKDIMWHFVTFCMYL